ncbi:hypothetical protein CH267_00055 [Rhodococcus sp. 06-621-2]|nr:hypothetical protein [Rhodococcus sp. 06-621-2]OZC62790.1 hypothetical protein CH267_00055 [Rhodococcus sp. 06-621-2]
MNYQAQLPDGASSLLDILRTIMWGCVLLGVGAILAGGWQLSRAHATGRPEHAGKGGPLIFGGLIIGASASILPIVLFPAEDTDTDNASASVDAPPAPGLASPAQVNTPPPAEPFDFDWTPVIWIGGGLAAIAVLMLAGYLVVHTRHRILDRRTAQATLAADFATAKTVYAQVADAYADYLADPYAIFTRPLLDDLDQPRTAAFITAFTDAGALNTDTCPASTERVKAFADASRSALTAWTTADTYARAIGMGVQSDDGKRTVRRIRSALDLALDDSAAAGERATAMATVQRLSNGLMSVPDRIYARAETAIETATRKQLTSRTRAQVSANR